VRLRLRQLWAATGALTVALFACGLLFGDLLGPSNNRSALYGILLLGAVLAFGWLVATSAVFVSQER
jgi:hypothetical protein